MMLTCDTISFLENLRNNNEREWFEANKKEYVRLVKEPAQAFADELGALLTAHVETNISSKIFRIYRDLRFSKDKRPYNTHIHMAFFNEDQERASAAWMVGLEPGQLALGFGVMNFSPRQLSHWRDKVSSQSGNELQNILEEMVQAGAHLDEPELARVPRPFASDHENANLLRRKSLVIWRHLQTLEPAMGSNGPANCFHWLVSFEPLYRWFSVHFD